MYGFQILCEMSKAPLKFPKNVERTPQNLHIIYFNFCVWFTISLNWDVISLSKTETWSFRALKQHKKPLGHFIFVYIL